MQAQDVLFFDFVRVIFGSRVIVSESATLTSRAESIVGRNLRTILSGLAPGAPIEESELRRELESALEFFVPRAFGWRHESIDAFRFAIARKVGGDEAEFIGLCLLITDQTWTPFHLRIRVSSDETALLDCKLGEAAKGPGGMVRTPYSSSTIPKLLHSLPGRIESICWVHAVNQLMHS